MDRYKQGVPAVHAQTRTPQRAPSVKSDFVPRLLSALVIPGAIVVGGGLLIWGVEGGISWPWVIVGELALLAFVGVWWALDTDTIFRVEQQYGVNLPGGGEYVTPPTVAVGGPIAGSLTLIPDEIERIRFVHFITLAWAIGANSEKRLVGQRDGLMGFIKQADYDRWKGLLLKANAAVVEGNAANSKWSFRDDELSQVLARLNLA
jgi:hypothetical protein